MPFQGSAQRLGSVVVEAHPIESGLFLCQAEQSGAGIAGLAMPGDRAHLGEAKTEAIPEAGRHTVFVETGRQANRIGETTTEQHLLEAQITPLQIAGQSLQHRGHQGPPAPQGRLSQSGQCCPRQLFGIKPLVIGQHRPQPALIKRAAAERGWRHGDRSGLF